MRLTGWEEELVDRWPEMLLRGLVQSDGCRFMNTGRGWQNPRYSSSNRWAGIRDIFGGACDRIGIRWTTAPSRVYVSRKADVERLDLFVGPKS